MKHLLLFLCIPLLAQLEPLSTAISLDDFGIFKNTNTPLQEEELFNNTDALRTNDFQVLQQKLASNRETVRVGYFYVSQGADGIGLTLPAQATNTPAEVSTETTTSFLIGATETTSFTILPEIPSSQTCQVIYSVAPVPSNFDDPQTMTDLNIIGSAFHDIRYNTLTPVITLDSAITALVVDEVVEASIGSRPLNGTKYRLTLANGQQLLFYFEDGTAPTILISTDRTTLTAQSTFTGFLRIAAIQPNAIAQDLFATADQTFDPWATAIIAQTRPITPIGMFMLWPDEWVQSIAEEITNRLFTADDVPSCSLVAELLPTLARKDLRLAQLYFTQLDGNETNLFLTQFLMLAAAQLDSQIAAYQSSRAIPTIPTGATAETIEAIYDAHRSAIPLFADIEFTEDRYTWTYTSDNGDPLIIFPSYKITDSPLGGYLFEDPIKGPLYAATATDGTITFTEPEIPTFYETSFFPTLTFTPRQLGRLQGLLSPIVSRGVINQTDALITGQEIFALALSAKAGELVYRQANRPSGSIRSVVQPLMDAVKEQLIAWLQTRTQANFFIADSTTPGICAQAGMGGLSPDVNTIDEGNALYNVHDLQYGYWLGAAALIFELDQSLNVLDPLISQEVSEGIIFKDLVDMLWRDARNFSKVDPDQLPFNRCGNPWEGHSTSNGILYAPLATGRFQERFGEDFNSWASTFEYTRAVLDSTAIDDAEKDQFDLLQTFARTNLEMTASSGRLVYQTSDWLFSGFFAANNLTVGQTFDTQVLSTTTFTPGDPCLLIPRN